VLFKCRPFLKNNISLANRIILVIIIVIKFITALYTLIVGVKYGQDTNNLRFLTNISAYLGNCTRQASY